ncbi:hypothetical protein TNCV_4470701 [Trichonephila clavipes]|uniref:C2H2-type domain-containing protein n=1 Tax=Trichonephila clavipes TaxID=2585209 RepID=A0A8X6SCN0_TRICX|nr:hypothetical protein TNCV_4470701 [Trichonephila clavipes]
MTFFLYLLKGNIGCLVVRASDTRPEGLDSVPDATKYPPSTHGFHVEIGKEESGGVAIYRPFGEVRRTKSYCHLCQVIYSQFGLAIHQNDHQARRRFVEWAQNEIAVVPDFHKRILFNDEAHFWLNGYVNQQNCRIWSEANPQVYVETPLHPEKLTVWCALWAGGILLQKR